MQTDSNPASEIMKKWDLPFLFNILDHIQDVVMVLDADTTIVYANEAYTKVLGVPVKKVLGRRLDMIETHALAIKVIQTGMPTYNLKDHIESLGLDVVGTGFPLKDNGKVTGCIAIFNNITEVERLNAELRRTKEIADYFQARLNEGEEDLVMFEDFRGQNSGIAETLNLAAKVARTDATVMIRGESGVGKDVLASAIHKASLRTDQPLIKVNCAAIPEALLESELFGYEEGAFSGAKKGGKLGKFELARGGSIFLDEIGDMTPGMQSKMLRVIQEKELERVGGTKTIKLDIRIISATNRDLEKMVKEGSFRQDLYYRLNIIPLYLLPLRERRDDIPVLCNTLLRKISGGDGPGKTVSPRALLALATHDWPGNVRELLNVLEYASIICNGGEIEPQDLPPYLRPEGEGKSRIEGKAFDIKHAVKDVERDLIIAALEKCKNNRSKAIRELGISRRTFYEKLNKYNIGA